MSEGFMTASKSGGINLQALTEIMFLREPAYYAVRQGSTSSTIDLNQRCPAALQEPALVANFSACGSTANTFCIVEFLLIEDAVITQHRGFYNKSTSYSRVSTLTNGKLNLIGINSLATGLTQSGCVCIWLLTPPT